jgi:hypothetical protein
MPASSSSRLAHTTHSTTFTLAIGFYRRMLDSYRGQQQSRIQNIKRRSRLGLSSEHMRRASWFKREVRHIRTNHLYFPPICLHSCVQTANPSGISEDSLPDDAEMARKRHRPQSIPAEIIRRALDKIQRTSDESCSDAWYYCAIDPEGKGVEHNEEAVPTKMKLFST